MAVTFAFGAAACAHAPSAPSPASKPTSTSTTDDFTPLTWEERHDVMTFVVLPNMGRLFQRFEKKPYPDLTCTSCHGGDAEARQYAMPASLPALDPRDPGATNDPARSRIVTFMRDEVTPTMRELIGKDAVSCFSCHPREK